MLHVYLTVIAKGIGLIGKSEWDKDSRLERIRWYEPASRLVPAKVHVSESFKETFRSTAKLLRHFAGERGSKWIMHAQRESAQYAIEDLGSLYHFAGQARRLSKTKQMPGTKSGQGSGWHFGIGANLVEAPPKKRR